MPKPSYDEWRRHDEARLVDFMIFAEVVDLEAVDLVIADGAWQVDNYLHENPELKRFAYVWLTDRVGLPPAPDADEFEAQLRIDANAAMVDLVGATRVFGTWRSSSVGPRTSRWIPWARACPQSERGQTTISHSRARGRASR